VSNIIIRLMDNMKLLFICILRVLLSHSFIFLRFYFYQCIYGFIGHDPRWVAAPQQKKNMLLFLFDNVIYVFLLL
jgi:hypothetical protein